MSEKGQIPHYNITDDILNTVAGIAEKVQQLPLGRRGQEGCQKASDGMHMDSSGEAWELVYRKKGMGVFLGEHLLGRAPMPQYLEELMAQLKQWLEQSSAHPLLKAGIVLYQYVMIQFFEGDNMRYGMQHAMEILSGWRKQLQVISLEEALHPEGLVRAFEQCDLYGEVSPFLLYFLRSILAALEGVMEMQAAGVISGLEPAESIRKEERVQRLLAQMGPEAYTNRELMGLIGLKHRPTFRDKYLLPAMAQGMIVMTIPDKPNSSQQRYRKTV